MPFLEYKNQEYDDYKINKWVNKRVILIIIYR